MTRRKVPQGKGVSLCVEPLGCYRIEHDDGRDIFVQTDWDFPGTATTFGWIACRKCGFTDGTVDCAHKTASAMIASARAYLDAHDGKRVEDPGYF